MAFDLDGKVALVTGGASGLGFNYVKELLRNGVKAITIADVSEEQGKKAVEDLEKDFGTDKIIFVKVDVCSKKQLEDAFKKTVAIFKYLDIVINNAGILNDACWEKEISINLTGTIYGTLLAYHEYFPKYRSGDEAIIVNISSIAGLDAFPISPVYTATKFAVLGFSRSLGDQFHYEKTKIKIITICPGVTYTTLLVDLPNKLLGPVHEGLIESLASEPTQNPHFVAKEVIGLIQKATSGSCWMIEGGESACELSFPSRNELKKV